MTSNPRTALTLLLAAILCIIVLGMTFSPGATETNITWETEPVDSTVADVGAVTSLILDNNDYPIVSYYDTTNGDLKMAGFNGILWEIEVVDANAPFLGAGEGTALALKLGKYPTIAYHRAATYSLHVAENDGSTWTLTPTEIDAGLYPDIAIDSSGALYFSHYKLTDQDLLYTYYGKGGWVSEVVDSGGNVGQYTSIALDSVGTPHIAYYDATHGDLRYAVLDTGGWVTTTLDSIGDVGKGASLAIESTDHPVISYVDVTNSALKLAFIDGKDWVTGTIDSTPTDIGDYTSLALDSYDRGHIAYEIISGGTSSLKYAHDEVLTWMKSIVDSNGSVGRYPSIALDSSNSPVISYYDITNGDLKVAHEYVPIPPDLVITDIWHEGSIIWYQVMNSGAGDAAAGHHTSVDVDGGSGKNDFVTEELAPGGRASRQFSDSWICTGITDIVEVCADSYGEIVESSEGNNCRQETWFCDTQAPIITTGPAVFSLSSNNATIVWTTDEMCSGSIEYGTKAGLSGASTGGLTPNIAHSVSISGLTPSTRYRYVAVCNDTRGNTVRSKQCTFETLAPAGNDPPTITGVTISPVDGYSEYYTVDVEVDDDHGVDSVSFYLDGKLLGTDYTSSSPFRAAIHPVLLALNQDEFYASHTISVTVTDGHGVSTTATNSWTPSGSVSVKAVWHSPGREINIAGPVGEASDALDIAVSTYYVYKDCLDRVIPDIPAYRLNDLVSLGAMRIEGVVIGIRDSRPPPIGLNTRPLVTSDVTQITLCDETRVPATRVRILNHGALMPNNVSYDPVGYHEFTYNLAGNVAGTTYNFSVDIDDEGVWIPAPQTHQVTVIQGQPEIEIDREVTRNGNTFDIALTVTNVGTSNISQLVLENKLTGFQPISNTKAQYDVGTSIYWHSDASWDLSWLIKLVTHPNEVLTPGNSLTMVYQAVPVLAPEAYDGHRTQGRIHNRVDVSYVASSGDTHVTSIDLPAILTTDGYYIDQAIALAIQSADYLIITDPDSILDFEPRQYYTNTSGIVREVPYLVRDSFVTLFNTMGEFARRKNAVIGFVNGQDRLETDGLIEEWGSRMDCHYEAGSLECNYLSEGYLLIVGEMEIVAPFAPYISIVGGGYRTVTDMYYADTSGNTFNPELSAGRISGNNALAYTIPFSTSIHLDKGDPGYQMDRSKVLLAQGFPSCRSGDCDTGDYRDVISAARIPLLGHGTNDFTYFLTSTYTSSGISGQHFITAAIDADIIVLAGHGNYDHWDDIFAQGIFNHPDPFKNANPVIYAASCLTGLYDPVGYLYGLADSEDTYLSFAEASLWQGASVYIGATQSIKNLASQSATEALFRAWTPGTSIGEALKIAKRVIGSDLWGVEDHWSAAMHVFGDPKIGLDVYPPTALTAQTAPVPEMVVSETLDIVVPDYVITATQTGLDRVTIPGGLIYLDLGQPLVPRYAVTQDIPRGYRIQEVTLTDRSGLTETTGLILPIATDAEDAVFNDLKSVTGVITDTGWYPDVNYEWEVLDDGDGSSTLLITIYPFYYNALTTDARFYSNYSFAIETITTTVEIAYLSTDAYAYPEGDIVSVELWLNNDGAAQDVVVDAVVRKDSSGEIVDGLLLHTLDDLEGAASFSTNWDTATFAPGDYTVEVELRGIGGELLDRDLTQITLGITMGEIASLTVSPTVFDIGETIDISMVFSNTGTLPITGTAVINVQGSGTVFTRSIEGLLPGSAFTMVDVWDTSGVARGDYRVMGTVYYDVRAADPIAILVSTERRIFLPLVVRQN